MLHGILGRYVSVVLMVFLLPSSSVPVIGEQVGDKTETARGEAVNKEVGKEHKMIGQLDSPSESVRSAASAEILKNRDADLQQIAALVEKYLSIDDRKATARDGILLLGKLHAAQYVPLLVKNMTFRVSYLTTTRPQSIEDLCPAVQALIDIGSPALKPVMHRVKSEDDENLQAGGAAVFRGVLGEEWAAVLLEYEIQAAGQSTVAERLRQVLHQLRRLPK